MQLFFNENVDFQTDFISFEKEESRHITKVLRKKIGDTLHLTNGKGGLFLSKIESDNDKECIVRIIEKSQKPIATYQLHIAIAPTKMNERFEWFLEKATEIGVSQITPLICENSERKTIKPERFERILLSAMKQSLQCYKPELLPTISFDEFIKKNHQGGLFIAHCYKNKKNDFSQLLLENCNHKITILIGPEGDFSIQEVETAMNKGFIAVSLGNTRLRTETAGVVSANITSIITQLKATKL